MKNYSLQYRINNRLRYYFSKIEHSYLKKMTSKFNLDLEINEIPKRFPLLRDQYDYCYKYFWNKSPFWLQSHRNFYAIDQRGSFEDAFYTMWFLLFKYFKPKSFLEIGVYRGGTLSLARLLSDRLNLNCIILGVTPLKNVGDSVSQYGDFDYYNDIIGFSKTCGVPIKPEELCKSFSTEENARHAISSRRWDIIYIDGNHDYEVVRKDFETCQKYLSTDGCIVLDDAGLNTQYKPRAFASKGHPGPSRVMMESISSAFQIFIQIGHIVVLYKNNNIYDSHDE